MGYEGSINCTVCTELRAQSKTCLMPSWLGFIDTFPVLWHALPFSARVSSAWTRWSPPLLFSPLIGLAMFIWSDQNDRNNQSVANCKQWKCFAEMHGIYGERSENNEAESWLDTGCSIDICSSGKQWVMTDFHSNFCCSEFAHVHAHCCVPEMTIETHQTILVQADPTRPWPSRPLCKRGTRIQLWLVFITTNRFGQYFNSNKIID